MEPYFRQNDRNDYRISPVTGDMTGLPHLLLEAGGEEMLRDQPEKFAEKARATGVAVTTRVWEGMPHVFQVFGFLPEAKRARRDACHFLSRQIALKA